MGQKRKDKKFREKRNKALQRRKSTGDVAAYDEEDYERGTSAAWVVGFVVVAFCVLLFFISR